MTLRIKHWSDPHSLIVPLYNKYDLAICSGDILPNSHHIFQRNRVREAEFQLRWLEDNVELIKQQLQGRDLMFVLGNHDFVHPQLMAQFLNSEDIHAIDLNDNYVQYAGLGFYGFPYIPPVEGNPGLWNYERAIPEMQQEVRKLVDVMNEKKVDVLVCHCPLYGCLDLTTSGDRIGNRVLNDALDYQIEPDKLPSYYLCGHNHEPGVMMRGNMLVSNMATSQTVLEILI